MRRLPYLIAAAAISGLALSAGPAAAAPLSSGLASGGAAPAEIRDGLVQNVHGWHCRKRWSRHRGLHRHRRACRDYSFRHHHFGVPFIPFFGLTIHDDDFRFRRRHHRRFRHHDWD